MRLLDPSSHVDAVPIFERSGVDRMIEILRSEIKRTMSLLGVSSLEELEPRHVTQLSRLVPVPKRSVEVAESLTS